MQRQRQEGQDAQKRLDQFRDVLEVVKNTLGNGAGALSRKRGENANLTAQIEEKRVNLETARRKYQASARSDQKSLGNRSPGAMSRIVCAGRKNTTIPVHGMKTGAPCTERAEGVRLPRGSGSGFGEASPGV